MGLFPARPGGYRTPFGGGRGPRVIDVGASGAAIPGGGMTLDALLARAKALNAAPGTEMGNMSSGLAPVAYAANRFLEGLQRGGADRTAAEAQAALGQALSQIDPTTGELPANVRGTVATLDPDAYLKMTQDMIAAARRRQELLQTHGWDVESQQAGFKHEDTTAAARVQAEKDAAALAVTTGRQTSDINRKAEDVIGDENAQRDAAIAEAKAKADAERAAAAADAQSARGVAEAGAKTQQGFEQRAKEAEALGLKPGTPEYNTFVATGGAPVHVDTPQEKLAKDTAARSEEAKKIGLKEGTPEYENYVLTGQIGRRPTMTPAELNLIAEADDRSNSAEGYIKEMEGLLAKDVEGLSVNDRAYSGYGAGAAQWAARNDPTGAVFDKRRGEATTKLENTIGVQALNNLKAIFGGNPTEGERQILLDLQGSKDKSAPEREQIIRDAISLARVRLQQYRLRASQLRQGTFAAEQGGPAESVDDIIKRNQ